MSILDAIAGERRYGAPRDRTRADIENLNPVNILDSVFRPSRNPNTGQVQYKHDATYQAIVSEVNEQYSKNTGRRFNDSMSVGEMRELLDTIDVPKGVRVTATKQGEYVFHYREAANRDKPLKLDPEAVQLAYASGAFKWDAPLPSVAQQAARGTAPMMDEMEDKSRENLQGTGIPVTRAGESPASSQFKGVLNSAESIVHSQSSDRATATNQYLQRVDALPKTASGSIIVADDVRYTLGNGKAVTLEAGTYTPGAFNMALDNLVVTEKFGPSVAHSVASVQHTKSVATPTVAPRELTAEEINDRPAIYAREDAMRAAVAPTPTARTTSEPTVAATVAAAPAPQPSPAAPAPQMAAPSAAPDIFNRIAGEISSAGQVRTANDDGRAVEAFLKANPVIGADGKPLTDTRAGFKDDGILSEQEATAALNRAQALRWSTGGKAAEALTALEASLNPTSTSAPVQAQASTEVTTATGQPAAKAPTNLLEGVNGFDKALAEAKVVRAETLQTALLMDTSTLVGGADQAAPKSSPVLASVQSSGMGASV